MVSVKRRIPCTSSTGASITVSVLLRGGHSDTSLCEDDTGKNGKEIKLPIKFGELYGNTEVNTEKLGDFGDKVEHIWDVSGTSL